MAFLASFLGHEATISNTVASREVTLKGSGVRMLPLSVSDKIYLLLTWKHGRDNLHSRRFNACMKYLHELFGRIRSR